MQRHFLNRLLQRIPLVRRFVSLRKVAAWPIPDNMSATQTEQFRKEWTRRLNGDTSELEGRILSQMVTNGTVTGRWSPDRVYTAAPLPSADTLKAMGATLRTPPNHRVRNPGDEAFLGDRHGLPIWLDATEVRTHVQEIYLRMLHSYIHEHRITSMDLQAIEKMVAKLGLGGCLDEVYGRNQWVLDPQFGTVEAARK